MTEQTQQEFLQAAKDAFGCTWDKLAEISGIKPRALKTYRMPAGSKDFRTLNSLAKDAINRALKDHKKELK
ncbi:hypothetical protein [Flavobacterium sp.]|uniref:hypothetical protein n=1 Tax=Flavobacterium sp. TaxID=239 RepID=UPI002627A7AF|nr:hypothetical protein [Flavobacterium sp.]